MAEFFISPSALARQIDQMIAQRMRIQHLMKLQSYFLGTQKEGLKYKFRLRWDWERYEFAFHSQAKIHDSSEGLIAHRQTGDQ